MNQCDGVMLSPLAAQTEQKMGNIKIEDLNGLESDLKFYHKVSLVFLLYGDNKNSARYAVERLCVGIRDETRTIKYLTEWAQRTNNWQYILIEALCIIKANKVLRKLGLNLEELQNRFLPNNPRLNIYCHPMLKCLYYICEQLTVDEAIEMCETIDENHKDLTTPIQHETGFLEMTFLRWISDGIIEIGQWKPDVDNPKRTTFCNVVEIGNYLKLIGQTKLVDLLASVKNILDFTTKNIIKVDKKEKQSKNKMDFGGDDDDNNDDKRRDQNLDDKLNDGGSSSLEHYKITNGIVLIINQRDFEMNPITKKQMKVRHGTDMDEKMLRNTFAAFGYKIISKENLAKDEIFSEIKNVVQESVKFDTLIVCLLSHGINGFIYDSQSELISMDLIKKEIITKELVDKPKILIFQSCRGEESQMLEAMLNGKLSSDGPSENMIPVLPQLLPNYSDVFIMYSTVPGYESVRHTEKGTYFIQKLCKCITEYCDRYHILDIFTKTCNEISKLSLIPTSENNLRKSLYFLPKK